MKTPKLLLLAASAVASAAFSLATANAAVIAQWNFATNPGAGIQANNAYMTAQSTLTTAVNQTVTPWTPPAGITVSTLTLGTGATFNNNGSAQAIQAYRVTGTSSGIAADFAAGSYEQFTVTIDASHSLNLTGVTIATSNSGVYNWDGNSYFSSSVTGQTTALGSGANDAGWQPWNTNSWDRVLNPYTVDLTSANPIAGTSLQGLTNTSVIFYVPIDFNATGNLLAGIQNLTLNGNLTAVPEPATWALLAGGLTVVTIFRRRGRQD